MKEEEKDQVVEMYKFYYDLNKLLGIDTRMIELKNDDFQEKLFFLKHVFSNSNFKTINDFFFNKISYEQIENLNNEILSKMFDKKYNNDILELSKKIVFIKNNSLLDGYTYLKLNNEELTYNIIQIDIPNIRKVPVIATRSHELIHGLLWKDLERQCGNSNYKECLSILVEKIVAYKLENEYGFKNTFDCVISERLSNIKMHITELYNSNVINDNSLARKYLTNFTYTYVISEMYASLLFDLYLQDNNRVINIISCLLDSNTNMLDVIKNNDLNLNKEKNTQYLLSNIKRLKK